jgi:hypothetical protein
MPYRFWGLLDSCLAAGEHFGAGANLYAHEDFQEGGHLQKGIECNPPLKKGGRGDLHFSEPSPAIIADPTRRSHAQAIADAAFNLNQLRENWLNPPEWVDWVITPEEEKAGFPKRPVAKTGHEAELKKRTLTNLYNLKPVWLLNAHQALDKAVANAYGWDDYTPEMMDAEILKRLLKLNLDRHKPNPCDEILQQKELVA